MRVDLSLDLEKTALLIVDLQEDQRSDPLCVADNLDRVLVNTAGLLGAAARLGIPGTVNLQEAQNPVQIEPRETTPGLPALASILRVLLTALIMLALGYWFFQRRSGQFGEEI